MQVTRQDYPSSGLVIFHSLVFFFACFVSTLKGTILLRGYENAAAPTEKIMLYGILNFTIA